MELDITERSDLIVSQKSRRTYFTVVASTGAKYVCFDPSMYNELAEGTHALVDIIPSKTPGSDPSITRPKDQPAPDQPFKKPKQAAPTDTTLKNKAFALAYAKDIAVALIQAKVAASEKQSSMKSIAEATVDIADKYFEPYLNGYPSLAREAIKRGAEPTDEP